MHINSNAIHLLPPNRAAELPKPMFFSRNLTHPANSNWLAEGGLMGTDRQALEKVEKLIELFEPFILHNEHDFVAENVEKLSAALAPEEREVFAYNTSTLDWWDYWINIHIPALRKWTYPLIEGRPLEARPLRKLQDANGADSETVKTGTNGASWRYS